MGVRNNSSVKLIRNNSSGSVPIANIPAVSASTSVVGVPRPFGFSAKAKSLLGQIAPPTVYEHLDTREVVKQLKEFLNLSVMLDDRKEKIGHALVFNSVLLSDKSGMREEISGAAFFAHRMMQETISECEWDNRLFLGNADWLGKQWEIFYRLSDLTFNGIASYSRFVLHMSDGTEDIQIIAMGEKLVIGSYGNAKDIPTRNSSDLAYLIQLLDTVSRDANDLG